MRINMITFLVGLGMIMVSCHSVEKNRSEDIVTITSISAERAKAFNDGNAAGI